jgi:hypothetical protein
MWAQDLQRYLRREEALRLLKEGIDPHIILEKYFELDIWKDKGGKIYLDKYKMRYYYEQYLFRDSGLTFEQIVEAYHSNPGNVLNRYRHGNVILKD